MAFRRAPVRTGGGGGDGGVTIEGTAYDCLILDSGCNNGGVISPAVLNILTGSPGVTPHGTAGCIQASYDSSTTDIVYADPAIRLNVDDLRTMRVSGGPVIEEHWEMRGPVGRINESWLEGNKLKIRARITDRRVADRIRDGTYGGLSIGYTWNTDGVNRIIGKTFREVSVCKEPVFKGCVFHAKNSREATLGLDEGIAGSSSYSGPDGLMGMAIKVVPEPEEEVKTSNKPALESIPDADSLSKSSIKKMVGDIFHRRETPVRLRQRRSFSPTTVSEKPSVVMSESSDFHNSLSRPAVPPAAAAAAAASSPQQTAPHAGVTHRGITAPDNTQDQLLLKQLELQKAARAKQRKNVQFETDAVDDGSNVAAGSSDPNQQQQQQTNDESDDDDKEMRDYIAQNEAKEMSKAEQLKQDLEDLRRLRDKERREEEDYAKSQSGKMREFHEAYKTLSGDGETTEAEQVLMTKLFSVKDAGPFAEKMYNMARQLQEKEALLRVQTEDLRKAEEKADKQKRKAELAKKSFKYAKGETGTKRKVANDHYNDDDDDDDDNDEIRSSALKSSRSTSAAPNPSKTPYVGPDLANKIFGAKGNTVTNASWEREAAQNSRQNQSTSRQAPPRRPGNVGMSAPPERKLPKIEKMFHSSSTSSTSLPREGRVTASASSGDTWESDFLGQLDPNLQGLLRKHERADPYQDRTLYLSRKNDIKEIQYLDRESASIFGQK